ncbi:hypothetical protein BV921_10610 [Pectobacterium odoriferum]|nr:hypothetical protein BV921_10610 [Pectobacterium odoriferum]POE19748.1 hypothetical protein BV918_06070 [Pectobacterium odoriferum]
MSFLLFAPFAFSKSDILRIGVDLTYAPFQSMDKNGNPSGFKIEVQQDTIQEVYANKYWLPAGVIVKSYPDQEAIYEDLQSGRVEKRYFGDIDLIVKV